MSFQLKMMNNDISIDFELYLLGWATFVKRRSAVQKINALPDATAEQLALNDDV